ncbi:LysM domain-containing protein [Kineothrix alysoides]|uniref:LysM domain-containing protein n=1 Tax=Kineothrix alysoides TaxID=1469948 RepID=A0A4R1QZV7_9FIRM|nr:LysM peptidoglycan-binding domain-containing protein [Kineothrix alysoides]TCL58538.1 LysM domain-containing protein [Kineothrix alysoides]
MGKSERRILNNKLRRKRQRRKNMFLFAMTFFLVATLSFGVNVFLSNAKSGSDDIEYKYYKSIIIQRGDTLISIASAYMDDNYASAESYVNELIKINGLRDDKIVAGNYLIIPYYSAEFINGSL